MVKLVVRDRESIQEAVRRFRKLVEEAEDRRLAALRRSVPKTDSPRWSDGS